MQNIITGFTKILSILFLLALPLTIAAKDIQLMQGIEPRPGDNRTTQANEFKKDGPWGIGMSHFGVNANTWTLQMSYESQGQANRDKRIKKFILYNAKISKTSFRHQ